MKTETRMVSVIKYSLGGLPLGLPDWPGLKDV